jgi:hypothetical protein
MNSPRSAFENDLLRALDRLKAARLYLQIAISERRYGKKGRVNEARADIRYWKNRANLAASRILRDMEKVNHDAR